jgi:drug/metabolite transporter superfamily protein YnfA
MSNGQINGKQIKDSSTGLVKLDLSGNQGTFLIATGSYFGSYETPTNPLAFVNKQYADSISAGLDPKESVYVVASTNITPNGVTTVIDGFTATAGKRILLAGQTSAVNNGIFIAAAGTWSRASDSNGSTTYSTEGSNVSLGNYTFIETGLTFSATGWVLYSTNATGATISPGVNTQLWTQFSGAGSFTWGNGLQSAGSCCSCWGRFNCFWKCVKCSLWGWNRYYC